MENSTLTQASSESFQEGKAVARILGCFIDWSLLGLTFLLPLWFMTKTLDVLELNKQTLLVVVTMLALVAWLAKALVEKKFSLSRSWLHLVVVFFGGGYLVTSYFSVDRYLSFVGNFGQMQWAFSTIVAFVILYLLIVNTVNTTAKLYHLVLSFLGSSSVVGIFAIFQMFGLSLLKWLSPSLGEVGFNTIGSANSLAMFMTVPLVLAASLTVYGCKDQTCVLGGSGKSSLAAKILVWITLAISTLTITMVDFWAAWATILFGTLVTVVITMIRRRSIGRPVQLVIPGILCVLSIVLLIWPTPLTLNLPAEVSPSASHSWQIARDVLRDRSLVGSGPGTWIYDYSRYRIPAVNMSPFWTYRFERGISSFFTLIAMLGLVGVSLWLILLLSAVTKSAMHLVGEKNDDRWQAYLTIFAGWISVTFTAFVSNFNVAHHFVFWLLLALLGSLVASGKIQVDGRKSPFVLTGVSIVFILLSVAGISTVWLAGQRLVADAEYSDSVESYRAGKPIKDSIQALESAIILNKLNDVYYRNLSQAYLIQASQQLQTVPESDRAKTVNESISKAIDNGRHAVDLSPSNVDNWSNLAVIYQAITSFTRGADEFALKNFQEALNLEPNNPVFYNEIGKIYILRADAYRTLLSSTDEKVKTEAQNNLKTELDKAAEQLNQSIQVKPDFAQAHYNLGILYERQGRIKDAITKLEQVLSINNKDIGVGFQLGILYYRNNDKDKALDIFQQIVALQPEYANARWFLSAMYEERGRYDDAIAQVQKIAETNAGSQEVQQRLNMLTSLRDQKKPTPVEKKLPEPLKEEIKGPAPLNEVKSN
ncbi:tetratricopeptide repeat protein [Candidatus Uhrbacteria bacterium]|nr:tetratricopeptide repeat protein [Candidatus Uhrbacteria bacterium]